ncbi:transmembrane 4 L6 family member 5 isoform X1 [Syngnathus scovelli]|uniref:transmembrane 4 L6 family member 5 isoform X1 n=1 Tax=Syngnathus scovelli TaxID=161590 RepID=UPI002110DD09|nr:transmembrane 4 L6 family member 5 isoform X2 [Syngnathus scovelli]
MPMVRETGLFLHPYKDVHVGACPNIYISGFLFRSTPTWTSIKWCLRCVGVALVALATVCAVANVLLLLPELKVHFLLEGHVTREATWATGLWSSGLLVVLGARAFLQSSHTAGCCAFRTQMLRQALYSCACLLSSAFCCLVSFTGLVQGPHCLYNTTNGPAWGVPLQPTPDRDAGYLYNKSLWSGVCLEPKSVVQWNVVLFSILGGASGLQALLCAANFINTLLGVVLGRGVGNNKVGPVSV